MKTYKKLSSIYYPRWQGWKDPEVRNRVIMNLYVDGWVSKSGEISIKLLCADFTAQKIVYNAMRNL